MCKLSAINEVFQTVEVNQIRNNITLFLESLGNWNHSSVCIFWKLSIPPQKWQEKLLFPVSNGYFSYLWVFDTKPHNLSPYSIHSLKAPPLFWHLLHNILRRKDGFQIQPLCLQFQPVINILLNLNQAAFPFLNKCLKNVNLTFPSK